MPRKRFTISAPNLAGGYYAQKRNRKPEQMTQPSVNVRLTQEGAAYTRPGYVATDIDLAETNKPARPFYMQRFGLTFFAVGTKVYYVQDGSTTKVDTGITLTDGTVTRFEEYAGQVLLTNVTDGARMIAVTKLNGAVTLGAATITVDKDGAARMDRFDTELSSGTKNLRINGTNEQYASIAVSTGVVTLSGTASAGYANDTIAIVVYDVSGRFPKTQKIVAWKESMNCIGIAETEAGSSSDVPPSNMTFSQFATAAAIENIVKLTGGTSGSELVGKAGILTNAVATRDYLYLFKEDETYFISVGDVNVSSGARPPQLFSANYGCLNADCAVEMGGFMVWLTKNRRVIKSNVRIEGGSSVLYPDESFDRPVREILDTLDTSQPTAHVFYSKTKKLLFIEGEFAGERLTLVYDNNLQVWLPPDRNKLLTLYYETPNGLYATAQNDDTVYEMETTTSDDGADIESIIATGVFEFESGRVTCDWKDVEVSGSITQQTEISVVPVVNGSDGTEKLITEEDANFSTGTAIGDVVVGGEVIGGDAAEELGQFDVKKAIYPAIGQDIQIVFSTFGDGHFQQIESWKITADAFSSSLLTTK